MKKIIAGVLIGASLITCQNISALAATDGNTIVAPLWVNISSVTGNLSVDGSTGYVTMRIKGNSDVTKIVATATLYYKSGSSWVKTSTKWDYSVNKSTLAASETFSASSGKTYKVVLSGTVYAGSTSETVSKEFIQS